MNKVMNKLVIGHFQLEVLLAIQQLRCEAYGPKIRDWIEKRRSKEVSTPQVYGALTRLLQLDLVSVTEDKSATAGKRGRPRRVYQLKPSGLRLLNRMQNTQSRVGEPTFANPNVVGS